MWDVYINRQCRSYCSAWSGPTLSTDVTALAKLVVIWLRLPIQTENLTSGTYKYTNGVGPDSAGIP